MGVQQPTAAVPVNDDLARRDIASHLHPFTDARLHERNGPMIVERAEGVRIFDRDGRGYVDGVAGLWCAALGYSEQRLVDAAVRQMQQLPFTHSFTHRAHEPVILLAEKLLAMAPVPMSKVFFANSGSEANDTIVKTVWYYHNAIGKPLKKKIISRQRSYHGVTGLAASLTGLPHLHTAFDLPLPFVRHTDCPDYYRHGLEGESEEAFSTRMAESLEALIQAEGPETIGAFIAEPLQGAGGLILPPAGYFEKIQAVLKRHDILLIADEVVTGFARTGKMFGCETYGLQPDFITLAKQLSASYMPISAMMISPRVYEALADRAHEVGTWGHGFTYSGHPVAAAVALETLNIYEERDILGHVNRVGPHMQRRVAALAAHPLVGHTRGIGLVAGVELVQDKAARRAFAPAEKIGTLVAGFAQARGAICRPIGDILGFSPPLIIEEAEIDLLFDAVEGALDDALAAIQARGLALG